MPKKKAAQPPAIPKQLFHNQKVCLAGRFDYSPNKDELVQLLEAEGATLVDDVKPELDLLIVGSGRRSAKQAKAEKLNTAGKATIHLVEDLKTLVTVSPDEWLKLLAIPARLPQLVRLTTPSWLFQDSIKIQSATFQGTKWEGSESQEVNLQKLCFEGCSFTNCKMRSVCLSEWGWQPIKECMFDGGQFDSVKFGNTYDCSFSQVRGKNISFDSVRQCRFEKARFSSVSMYGMNGCEFHNSIVNNLRLRSDDRGTHIIASNFSHTTFDHITCGSPVESVDDPGKFVFESCTLTDVVFRNSELHIARFSKCRLQNVKFQKLEYGDFIFDDCELVDCQFINCQGRLIDFGNSHQTECTLDKCQILFARANDAQLAQMKPVPAETLWNPASYQNIEQFVDIAFQSGRLEFTLNYSIDDKDATELHFIMNAGIDILYKSAKSGMDANQRTYLYGTKATKDDIRRNLLGAIIESGMTDIDPGSIRTKLSKCPLKPAELKQLIYAANCEVLGKPPQTKEEIAQSQKKAKAEATNLRKEILADLEAGRVAQFNRRELNGSKNVPAFKKSKLAGAKLKKIKLVNLDFSDSDLSAADLSGGNLENAQLRKVNLAEATLKSANLKAANLRGADLTAADFTKAKLVETVLTGANTKKAIFNGATIKQVDLCGVDLSTAELGSAKLANCYYNEKTRFPTSVTTDHLKSLNWVGGGLPPHERSQNKPAQGPLDFDSFMERLNEITDSSRLKKATKMLKADSFQLFSEIATGSVAGVVKSQTDSDLVYSCSLNHDGQFACCTQNLNPCGGLRGSICKHILVLVIGLTKSGELDATAVDEWVNHSKLKQPELDKDKMSEILLKYKGAQAGEIDWRPTETVPEDYFAF